eukprot:192372-Karenia_brevis.AAC.2
MYLGVPLDTEHAFDGMPTYVRVEGRRMGRDGDSYYQFSLTTAFSCSGLQAQQHHCAGPVPFS